VGRTGELMLPEPPPLASTKRRGRERERGWRAQPAAEAANQSGGESSQRVEMAAEDGLQRRGREWHPRLSI